MLKYIITGVLIAIILLLLYYVITLKSSLKATKEDIDNSEIFPYKQKYLLTKPEWQFYKKLKPVCDENNLHIIAKVRLADLIEVDKNKINNNEYMKYFSKIKSKHIDFVICSPENLKVIALIELDDKSHENETRIKRDNFINQICKTSNYNLIHMKQESDIKVLLISNNIIHSEQKE